MSKKRKKLLTGLKRLKHLVLMINNLKYLSPELADTLIEKNLNVIKKMRSEESVLLLGEKALLASRKQNIDEAQIYADKALTLSIKIDSSTAESAALTVKGYLKSAEKQHKKAAAWYILALEKSSKLQRPHVLSEIGTCYSQQGEYDRALTYLNDAINAGRKLINDKSISFIDNITYLTRILTEAFSRIATVYESIDDLQSSLEAYNSAMIFAQREGLVWEQCKVLLGKARFFIRTNNLLEAKSCLTEAENLPLSGQNFRASIYIAHAWARIYRAESRDIEATDKYAEILYGKSSDNAKMDQPLLHLMKNTRDFFGEILSGIHECLIHMGEERKAEHLDSATRQYEEALKDFGIYKDIDKQAKLEVLEKHIIAVLERIFQKRPFIVRYKDILAEYHSDKEKASIMKGALRLTLNKRAFLIFQYLVEHMGECVTKADLHQYWIKHEEGYASKECIRTYINRDIRGKLGLQLSRDDCPKKTGWILSP